MSVSILFDFDIVMFDEINEVIVCKQTHIPLVTPRRGHLEISICMYVYQQT